MTRSSVESYSNPLLERYASAEMARIFSARFKFETWRRLWLWLAEEEKRLGLPIPEQALVEMRGNLGQIDFEAAARDLARDELVDARGEHVFVVGAVEDADHAARRDLGVDAPEEVVAGFERGGHLEGCDIASLGVDAGEDVADGAVFAGGVHALKDDEQGLGLAGVEDIL